MIELRKFQVEDTFCALAWRKEKKGIKYKERIMKAFGVVVILELRGREVCQRFQKD